MMQAADFLLFVTSHVVVLSALSIFNQGVSHGTCFEAIFLERAKEAGLPT